MDADPVGAVGARAGNRQEAQMHLDLVMCNPTLERLPEDAVARAVMRDG